MRIAESPPSLDLERSFYDESILFLDKNHLCYYLNLKTPVFTDFQNYAWQLCFKTEKIPPILPFTPAGCFTLVLILLQQALKMDE